MPMMMVMELLDPSELLEGKRLREVVRYLLDNEMVSFEETHAQEMMNERRVTTGLAIAVLRSGTLASESCTRNKWRYRATGRGIYVIFTFDVDEDGNALVVITTVRP